MRQILYADCELYMALLTFLKQGTVQFVSATISQGPLHMSVVNRAGSVSEISPCHSFLLQKFCWVVHMRSLVGPVTKILFFPTQIFVTEAFLYEHFFDVIIWLLKHSDWNGLNFVFPLQRYVNYLS